MLKIRTITTLLAATLLALSTTACRQAAPSPEPTVKGGTDRITTFYATLDTLADVVNQLETDSTIIMTGQVTESDISTLKSILTNSSHNIKLDLSGVTGLDKIPHSGFMQCNCLLEIRFPTSLTNIDIMAFYECKNLKTVHLSQYVTNVGVEAFSRCTSLQSINVDENNPDYTSENGVLFNKDKTELVEFPAGKEGPYTIPNGVITLGSCAFVGNEKIKTVTIPNTVKTLQNSVFAFCPALETITIPDTVTSLGNYVFWGCRGLKSVTLSNSLTALNHSEFDGCSSLTSIVIPNSVTVISSNVFSGCSKLESVQFSNSLVTIEMNAFSGCGSLSNVVLPNTLKTMGNSAFSSCSKLTSITIPDSVTSLGDTVFSSCKFTTINIPKSVLLIGRNPFPDTISSITVDSDNPNFKSINGVLFSKDGKKLIACPGNKEGDYIIPDTTESLYKYAFYNCKNITSITIPNTITDIGFMCFYGCKKITDITIPASVTSIDRFAFYLCDALTSISFNDTNNWKTTTSETVWINKNGGTEIEVTDTQTNVTNLKKNYYTYYWYKGSN